MAGMQLMRDVTQFGWQLLEVSPILFWLSAASDLIPQAANLGHVCRFLSSLVFQCTRTFYQTNLGRT
jgi:hypothetical protein